jgi:hypothetical protein
MNQNNQIFPVTKWVVALIVPFLLAAFIILYLFPDNTTQLFAWTINPRMTPLLMGAGYISGVYFFVRMLFMDRWHRVAAGFLPVASFASLMGAATIVHWDRFNHNHPAFYAWSGLYFTTPFIVFLLWLNNRRAASGAPESDDAFIPGLVRMIFALVGFATLLLGGLLFLFPQWFIPFWPWQLTPLTARVGGGWLAMPGVFAVLISRDRRWSSARLALESLSLSFALLLLAVPRGWKDFDQSNPYTWVFIGGAFITLAAISALYYLMESLRRRSAVSSSA